MKPSYLLVATICFSLLFIRPAFADEPQPDIPEKVPQEHWSCKEISDLGQKYSAQKKLPVKPVLERAELLPPLVSVMEKVIEKAEKDGPDAVPKEDLGRLNALHSALKTDLAGYEGYQVRRESIEAMLSKAETPPFEYRFGLNGFLRGEGVNNFTLPDFSNMPNHAEGRFVYRIKPYAYWHPTDWIDIHAEGQGYGYRGGSHQEFNKLSLYQGFLEVKTPGSDRLALKGGRQEFSYGSTFILGTDSFYDGLSFDAARLRIKPSDPLAIDLLVGSYARPFSDGVKGNLAGAYLSWQAIEGSGVDLYAFRDSGSADHHAGEYTAVWGLRGTAKFGPFSIEVEPVYESGEVFNSVNGGNDRIDAYGGHADVTVESAISGFNNKFFLSYAIGSGSSDAAGGGSSSREFRNPNNNTSLIGDLHVFGDMSGVNVNGHHASGMQIYTLGWGIDLSKELNFSTTGRAFRAEAVETGFHRNLGIETDFTATYAVNENLSIIIGFDRFFTGGFFRDASGSSGDIDYGYLMLQFDIFKSKPRLKKV